MASILKIALFIAVLVGIVSATDGGGVSEYYNASTLQCARQNGWHFIIVRSYLSYGSPDVNAPDTLANAKAAGIPERDVYHFPCMGKVSAAKQVADNYARVRGQFGMMWFNIETNPSPGCGFSAFQSANCQFLGELITAGNSHGIKMGIYTSSYMWSSIMGKRCYIGADNGLPLWYESYDGRRSFSDFRYFGGWARPAIKKYADNVGICGITADANWYEAA